MSEVSKNEQLIHALLDGELDDVRAQEARKMLATDRQLAKCHDDCLAQREALASMTRFTLPEDFSGRVLQAAQTSTASATTVQPVSTTARSGRIKWQIATTAILSSAATLLFSMFLLPTGQTDNGSAIVRTTPHSSSVKAYTDPIVAEVSDSLVDEESMAAALAEPPIEQVWLLEAQDNQSGVKLARTLAANSIQVPAELSGDNDDELIETLDQEINGILIEASAIQMKKALLELADSEQFEISAFTLPGHDAYFADIQQAQASGNERVASDQPSDEGPEEAKEEDVVASADQLAAEAMAAAGRAEGKLTQPPVTMAQQLWQRRFSKKKSAAFENTSEQKKTLFTDGLYSEADGPEGLGGSAAPLFDIDELPAVKQNVEALFPEKQQSTDPKGNYLLLIRNAPKPTK